MSEDMQFVDTEGYSNHTENISYRDIVLNHLKVIGKLASVEFRGGYKENSKSSVGGQLMVTEKYVPDTRQIFINAVDYLADLLFPHFDEDMSIIEQEINKKIENFQDNNSQNYLDKVLIEKKKLFRQLSAFLFRTNYLAKDNYEEEAI